MFTINVDNCLFLSLFPLLFLVSPSLLWSFLCVHVSRLHPFTRSIIDFISLHLVVECGIHGLVQHLSCHLNNIAALKQWLASFQHLRAILFFLDTEVFVLCGRSVFCQGARFLSWRRRRGYFPWRCPHGRRSPGQSLGRRGRRKGRWRRDTRRESERRSNEEQTLNRSSWMSWIWSDPRMQTIEPCDEYAHY